MPGMTPVVAIVLVSVFAEDPFQTGCVGICGLDGACVAPKPLVPIPRLILQSHCLFKRAWSRENNVPVAPVCHQMHRDVPLRLRARPPRSRDHHHCETGNRSKEQSNHPRTCAYQSTPRRKIVRTLFSCMLARGKREATPAKKLFMGKENASAEQQRDTCRAGKTNQQCRPRDAPKFTPVIPTAGNCREAVTKRDPRTDAI